MEKTELQRPVDARVVIEAFDLLASEFNRVKQMVGQPNAGTPRPGEALTKEMLDTMESLRQTAINHGQLIHGLVNGEPYNSR